MGRVIRNQRKGRGSIFSQSSPTTEIFDDGFEQVDDRRNVYFRQVLTVGNSGQHAPEQEPRQVPHSRLR